MKPYRQIRRLRAIAAIIVLVLCTAAFCDMATGLSPIGRHIIAMQFFPALVTGSLVWLFFWLAAAFLFGRIYCSVFCPLGIFMDICARLPRVWRPRRRHYHHTTADNALRLSVLGAVAVCALFSVGRTAGIFDPAIIYGRAVAFAVNPLYMLLTGLPHPADVIVSSGLTSMVFSLSVIIVVGIVAQRRGRSVCNTVCPVGTLMAVPASLAVLHMDINTDLCTNCYACVHSCKSHCIDLNTHLVDLSRCVVCFDCADACDNGAITYRRGRHRIGTPLVERLGMLRKKPEGKLALDFDAHDSAADSDSPAEAVCPLAGDSRPNPINDQSSTHNNIPCASIYNCYSTSSTTARPKATAPAPAHARSSAIRCASTSAKDSLCSPQKNSTSNR